MQFDSENKLEQSLIKAASDPVYRPQFYKDLCDADLFIIQHDVQPINKHERITLEEDQSIQLQNIEYNGNQYIPVFSSLTRLKQFITEEVAYLGINALELMNITKGAELLLNPGSDYGKEFTKEEILSVIDGSILTMTPNVNERESQVLLGQPSEYPQELVDLLFRFFRTKKAVKKAWLAHYHNPSDGLPPHTLIAIDAGNSYEAIIGEVGMIIDSINIPNPPVDIIPMLGTGGLEEYFLYEQKPFYKKKLLGMF